jgi:hypothetical protein
MPRELALFPGTHMRSLFRPKEHRMENGGRLGILTGSRNHVVAKAVGIMWPPSISCIV